MSPISFDPALPVSQKREEIARAVAKNPVVIVCGETGSGKTTQIPKILLEMGRGAGGMIGHTQPRRIAARTVAARIAEELKVELGGLVGYKVRFHDRAGTGTVIKLMTDGILLAETQGDPQLRAYDTIILDEAHERSLNIDFLLGYVKKLIEKRRDLKIVVTSATIDAEKFSKHFNGAPVIEVSGRLYPVEVRYRPVEGDKEDTTRDEEEQALADAVVELCRGGQGDVLVFLPGEREIRKAAEVLGKAIKGVEILPLYSRLSNAEQDRVFRPGGAQRVVLATNVAETSLTVPRIRYVVDTGLARVKRYSYRNKVEMLQVENISQASARQRSGRCGRVADGISVRLYSEEDYNARSPFTDPEVLRSSLAAVILRALSLNLGKVEEFPFLDPPSPRAIADGYALLNELGAVDEENVLTDTGRELARLPLDPRVGRMLVAARGEGCLEQMLVVAAALSVRDPRDRPLEAAAAADERHAKFADERSDFLGYLKLWKAFGQGASPSRKQCRENFVSYVRLREWRDIHSQLRQSVEELDWKLSSANLEKPEGVRAIHRALLCGLLGNIGLKDDQDNNYTGARGIKFWVHPGSGTKKPGKWIMAAELVETTRLFARNVASVDPRWMEELGAHLLRRHRERPHWEKTRAQVVAVERGTLYGLPVYADRRVHYGPVDPKLSREIFLRSALVEGEFETRAPFFAHNQRLLKEIERLEHKSRRPDILVDDELIYAFYDARVPEGITNGADFEKWRREAERAQPGLLQLRREDLMRHEAAGITTENFPHELQLGLNRFALEYHFEPRSPRDGVTMTVPVALLNQVPAARCEWLVPGLLKEKVQAYAKGMPQRLRHKLGPLAEFAQAFAAAVPPSDAPLAASLARYIRAELGLEVPADAFRPDSAPPHLQMNFRVMEADGRQLAMGRNVAELKGQFSSRIQESLSQETSKSEDKKFTVWNFGDLEEMMEIRRGGQTLIGYPALQDAQGDENAGVTLQVFDSPERAREVHRAGVLCLLAIAFRDRLRDIEKALAKDIALAALKDDIVSAALERTFLAESLPMRQAEFAQRVQEGRNRLTLIAQEMQRIAARVQAERAQVLKRIAATQKAYPQAAEAVKQQVERLLQPGFLARIPWPRLQHFPRYLKAAALRLDKLRAPTGTGASRDAERAAELAPLEQAWQRERISRAKLGGTVRTGAELEQFGWLLEELRVSLFAQELKTPVPVSVKRLAKLWQSMRQ
ncbi:MAG: ATP-dependent RNA helicase HrpA [Betaproteobacteria bacterium]|nr:ATP-dependent RNA helicase HrpA [Betaproteobacteria bacterium]